ncbi:AAA family ATPase [Shewanella waksmanii]|uniref:AAA family ATPase n=1 Tax=Shewanella waksmanii TaxID=213783 RepID=UPI0037370394
MTLNSSFLLPSQDALLQRLQHVVLYGQQLTVLTGDNGCGKTSILTELVEELSEVSSAFVTCPMHCDSAEIRRKVLVQLLSEPAFDDEIPMPETLLKLASSLPVASHIVLDDAHHLPLEIWAECIVLSQLSLNGRRITVTLSTTADYLDSVVAQLPDTDEMPLLPMAVEPLDNEEREGLYYLLLSRSEQVPFTPREIVAEQLAKQTGRPDEVVKLFELALNGEPEVAAKASWMKPLLVMVIAMMFAAIGYAFFTNQTAEPVVSKVMTVSEARANAANLKYAHRILLPYFQYRHQLTQMSDASVSQRTDNPNAESEEPSASEGKESSASESKEPLATVREEPSAQSEQQASMADTGSKLSATVKAEVETREALASATKPAAVQDEAADVSDDSRVNIDVSTDISSQSAAVTSLQMPTKLYTLQLASVKQRQSLDRILAQLSNEPNVRVAKDKQRWVVLYGDFATNLEAQQQGKRLVTEYQIGQPWLRAWRDIGHYDIQKAVPSREIQ